MAKETITRDKDRKKRTSNGSSQALSSTSESSVAPSSSMAAAKRKELNLKPLSSFLNAGSVSVTNKFASPPASKKAKTEIEENEITRSRNKRSDPLEAIELSSDDDELHSDSTSDGHGDNDEVTLIGFRGASRNMTVTSSRSLSSSQITKTKPEPSEPSPSRTNGKGKQRAIEQPLVELEVTDSSIGKGNYKSKEYAC